MMFAHEAFSGHGAFLLRWLGFPSSRAGYAAMLVAAFPEFDALALLDERQTRRGDRSCAVDVAHLQSAIRGEVQGSEGLDGVAEGAQALSGGDDEPVRNPEDALQSAELCLWVLLTHDYRAARPISSGPLQPFRTRPLARTVDEGRRRPDRI